MKVLGCLLFTIVVMTAVDSFSVHLAEEPDVVYRKRSTNGVDEGTNQTNSSLEEYEGNVTHEEHAPHEVHKMHVVSWQFDYVKEPFIIAVFIIFAGIAKLGFHHANFLSSKVPESCLLIILGTIVGAILYGSLPRNGGNLPSLDAKLFFLYLLPPIILESAYSLHDRTFYENVGTVMIYAVLGTVLNCFLIGPSLYGIYKLGGMGDQDLGINLIQSLVFSAIIVAVDPVAVLAIFQEVGVNNTLYFLVFGESLFNDAVTVVLYNMMKTLNQMDSITADQVVLGVVQFFVVSTGGLAVGIVFGITTAIITRFTEHCRVVEPLAVFVLAYLSYLMAEMFHFSGIISIIGCGLTQAQYAFHNISKKSYTTVKYFGKMMSATCDCIIFMFLGISLFKQDVLNPAYWHIGFIGWTILFCLLYRFVVVFLLTFLINRGSRMRKIDLEEQFIMAYGGLRGAVAFSLVGVLSADNLPKGQFLTTTLIVIFFTVFIQGATIKPLVKLLRVKMEQKDKLQLGEEINIHVTDHVMAGIEEITGQRGEHYFREMLDHYNRKYLKKWLQRNPISSDEKIMQYFEKLALEQHFEQLAGSKMVREKYGSEADLEEIGEAPESEGEVDSDVDVNLPVIPIHMDSESEEISSELDEEILAHQTRRRRRALFPVTLTKDEEKRLNENPTAEDIRKIMIPSRKEMNFKRLDKNLKRDDSENDLLRFLQLKEMRTRRLSQAVWKSPTATPDNDSYNRQRLRLPRRSLAPVAADNYRRRLSLALPEVPTDYRRRSNTAGYGFRGLDSPARRRIRLRRGLTTSSDHGSDSGRDFPLGDVIRESEEDLEKVGFDLEDKESPEKPQSNDVRRVVNSRSKHDSLGKSDTKYHKNSVINSRSKHGSLRRSGDPGSQTPDDSRKGGSFRGQASRMLPSKTPQKLSPKHSPRNKKKKFLVRSKTENLETVEEMEPVTDLSGDTKESGLRKNPSYSKALSMGMFQKSKEAP